MGLGDVLFGRKKLKAPAAPADQEKSLVAEAVVNPFFPECVGRTGIDGSFSGGRRRLPVAGAGPPHGAARQQTGTQDHELPSVHCHR